MFFKEVISLPVIPHPVIDTCPVGLRVLKFPADTIDFAIFAQSGSGLMKIKRDLVCHTLPTNVEYPIVVTHSRFGTRFAADRDFLDDAAEITRKIERAQQRGAKQKPMTYRQRAEYGQAVIEHRLIFYRAGNGHMVISVAPIGRQGYPETLDSLSGNDERQVTALPYHRPRLGSPLVGLFEKEIGGETGIDPFARRHPVIATTPTATRQIEGRRASDHTTIFVIQAVAPINVTMPATFAYFMAPMPRIPRD